MMEWYFRPAYQRWCVEPLIQRLNRWPWFTPARLTWLAMISGFFCAVLLWRNHPLWACAALWLSGYLDTLDGSLARLREWCSPRGAVLDIVADRVVEISVMIGIYSVAPSVRGFAVIAMFASTLLCVTSFLVIGIFVKNSSEKSFHYSRGWMERPEAFVLYTLMILLPQAFFPLSGLYVILLTLTAGQHVLRFFVIE